MAEGQPRGGTDDAFSIDWSETAYMPTESQEITEESFNGYPWKFPSYKEYFNFIRKIHKQPPGISNKQSLENKSKKQSPAKADKLSQDVEKKSIDKSNKQSCRGSEEVPNKRTKINTDTQEVNDDRLHTNYHMLMNEPRRSSVSVIDRRFYHHSLNNHRQMQGKKLVRMKDIMTRICSEQIEYQQFLHHSASNHMKKYLYLNDEVKNCVVSYITDSVSKLLQPQKKFKMLQQINLEQLPAPNNPFLTFVRRVHEEGAIPMYNIPELGTKLPLDAKVLTAFKENLLSEDTIVTICKSEAVEFCMTSSALIAIMEGLAVNTREWMLPLEVKGVEIGNEEKRKVFVISDPLPRRIVSTREVNNYFYENALKQFMKTNQVASKSGSTQVRPGNTCDDDLGIPGEDLIIDMDENEEDGVEKHSGVESNIHVNLFSLGDFNILLETTVDGRDNVSQKTFQISPKCEYQHVIGCEQFSLLELCNLFWNSHIANTDWIVCSRVDIWNHDIVRNDMYTRDVLCPQACPYQPRYFCNHLHYILNELRSLISGEYILEHAAGENCIKVLQENDGDVTYATMYNKDTVHNKELIVELTSPWLPIDTTILTASLIEKEFIPCLFGQFQKWKNPKQGKNKNKKQGVKTFTNKWSNTSNNDIGVKSEHTETPIFPTHVNASRQLTSYDDEF